MIFKKLSFKFFNMVIVFFVILILLVKRGILIIFILVFVEMSIGFDEFCRLIFVVVLKFIFISLVILVFNCKERLMLLKFFIWKEVLVDKRSRLVEVIISVLFFFFFIGYGYMFWFCFSLFGDDVVNLSKGYLKGLMLKVMFKIWYLRGIICKSYFSLNVFIKFI